MVKGHCKQINIVLDQFHSVEFMMGEKEDRVVRAIMAEQAERYEDMARYMKSVTEEGSELSNDERNLLSVAYKNLLAERRNAWRIISSIEKTYGESDFKKQITNDYRNVIASEQRTICEEVLCLLDRFLIPNVSSLEPKVFYLKMKGDYYRYLAEVKHDDASREKVVEESHQAYQEAYAFSKEQMPPTHPIRLGLALNFSVFHYEILNQPEKACELASTAFDEAMHDQDMDNHSSSDDGYKDAMLILQLLRDNLTLWTSEIATEDNEQTNILADESYLETEII